MAGETLPDRKYHIIVTNLIITPLAAAFVVWRLVLRFRTNAKLGLSEYLMVAGVFLNSAANITAILGAYNGQGRLDEDPFLTPARRMTAMHLIYASQSLNVYAIFIVKLSICAYLMPLAFRQGFRAVIWMSVVVVVVCNFIIPSISHFGVCEPIAMNWNPKVQGNCWPLSVKLGSAYTQAAANIATDLVYAASPMVYLGEISLPRRTKLGIRIVFVLALAGTALSVVKLWELNKVLKLKQDFLYGSIDLSVYSAVEVGITVIVACLPPLRKIFDNILQKILRESIMGRALKTMTLPSFATNNYTSNNQTRTGTTIFADSETDEGVLAEEEEKKHGQIVETTRVGLSNEDFHAEFDADGQQPHT